MVWPERSLLSGSHGHEAVPGKTFGSGWNSIRMSCALIGTLGGGDARAAIHDEVRDATVVTWTSPLRAARRADEVFCEGIACNTLRARVFLTEDLQIATYHTVGS